jgi:hydrogenase maturation factor
LIAERRPLELRDGRLALGEARPEEILHSVDGKGFTASVRPGDWVSIHWGWACEVLDDRKLANLVRVSQQHLEVANRTI